jgi:signal transduction histidine kinase/DNA-binding response OmpR family regulator
VTEQVGKINLLIVDDKADKLLALGALLADLNENIVLATSGREALRHVLHEDFAVILLDINMPGMDGFETAQLIRQRKRSRTTPIIFLTAAGDEFHLEKSYSLGAVDYILTPVVPDVLKTKVKVFVDLFRSTEQVRRQAESLKHHAAQLHKLADASLAIHASLSLDTTLQAITDAARDIAGAHQSMTMAALGQSAEHAHTAISLSAKYPPGPALPSLPTEQALYQFASSRNGTLRMTQTELETHPAWSGTLGGAEQMPPMRGFLSAPLRGASGRTIGLIQLSEKTDGDFTYEDESLLAELANVGSIAIQKCLHAEALEANRLKDEFLGTLSHELRTPLNAILGWARLMRMGQVDPANLARGLEVIERNVSAQAKLIEDLLDISRITSGKLILSVRPISLLPLLEAAIDAQRPAVATKQITLSATLNPHSAPVLGDPDRLQQVASNLLSNAVKFTPVGGHIQITLQQTEEGVAFQVTDNGDGISAEFIPHVFERFRQADSSSRKSQAGLGIGLAIVRHIIELHGGIVHASSPGLRQGSTFLVRLPSFTGTDPVSDAPSEQDSAPAFQNGSLHLQWVHVLVVDDDPDAREVLREVLSRYCARVTAVASAREALDALGALSPDVLISDVAMPGEDGYELIRQVRKRTPHEGGNIPALALTAYAGREDQARALAEGFQLHAAKPIQPDKLIAAVAMLARDCIANLRSSSRPPGLVPPANSC